MIDKMIIYDRDLTTPYGRRNARGIDCSDYENDGDWKEIIKDRAVKWAKLIDSETGKIFKSYTRNKK